LPKAYLYQNKNKKKLDIVRPLVEIEMPNFIALAEEILEEELARQAAEALRLLRETPVLLFSKA